MKMSLDWKIIQKYYDNNHSIADCEKYFKSKGYKFSISAAKRHGFKSRTSSETSKLTGRNSHPHSERTKQRLRQIMIKRHRNGEAHTFAHNKRAPSYPEQWFRRVIANHFNDKQYIAEYRLGRYSLDFAWVKKKKVIEIDGEQHYTQKSQIESDKNRYDFLNQQNWNVLRLRWKSVFTRPKYYINIARNFIDDNY